MMLFFQLLFYSILLKEKFNQKIMYKSLDDEYKRNA